MSESISQLTEASSANDDDLIPATQGSIGPGTGTTRTITPGQIVGGGFDGIYNTLTVTAGGALAGMFTGAPTLSGNLTLSGNPVFSGAPDATGTFTLAAALAGWSSSNWGKQAVIAGSGNPSIAMKDNAGINLLGFSNNSGVLQVASMPALSDNATAPNIFIEGNYANGVSLRGTATNNNASAGRVGEVIESSVAIGSAVSLTSDATANITTISLTAGDWDVWGSVSFIPAVSTTIAALLGSISAVSLNIPTAPNGGAGQALQATFSTGLSQTISVGMRRVSLASTTTYYLVCSSTFAVSTMAAAGYIGARRAR